MQTVAQKVWPFTMEVANLFDVAIRHDLSGEACPHCDGNGEKHGHICPDCGGTGNRPTKPVYGLGRNAEPAAGLYSYQMTPWFDSLGELENFCKRNIERFRTIAAEQEKSGDYEAIDATDWK